MAFLFYQNGGKPLNEVTKAPNFKLNKNRYLELKYYCLQYDYWKTMVTTMAANGCPLTDEKILRASINQYNVENSALCVNCEFTDILLDCVTHGVSYKKLKAKYEDRMPDKDTFSGIYRAFFYFLDKYKGI